MSKRIGCCALVTLAFVSFASAQGERTTMDVYYESLCPDSFRFITTQLYPNWRPSLSSFINLRLIPFGKANFTENPDGGWFFTCQHGPNECAGNILHACGIDSSANISQALTYVDCLMANPGAGLNCSNSAGLDFAKVDECRSSLKGQTLVKLHGDETLGLQPTLFFVPWIIYNKNWAESNQWDSLTDVVGTACRNAPSNTPACAGKSGAIPMIISHSSLFLSISSLLLITGYYIS